LPPDFKLAKWRDLRFLPLGENDVLRTLTLSHTGISRFL
jgi:hypothetical protein